MGVIGTAKIMDDTVIPTDIDETADYSFTSTSNSLVATSAVIATGRIATGNVNTLSGTTVTVGSWLRTTSTASGSGYMVQSVVYPTGVTSTVFLNSICTATSMIWLSPFNFSPHSFATSTQTAGSMIPYVSAVTSGSFTLASGTNTSSALAYRALIIN